MRIKAEALLSIGKSSQEVADSLGLKYTTVQGWKRALDKKQLGTNDIEQVVEVDLPTLKAVADKVKLEAPEVVGKKIDKLVDGVTSLKKLEPKFHSVVLNLLEAAEEMSLRGDLSVKDWHILSQGIGALYNNIFGKSGTNVNVINQNNIHNEKLSMFKGSMRNV